MLHEFLFSHRWRCSVILSHCSTDICPAQIICVCREWQFNLRVPDKADSLHILTACMFVRLLIINQLSFLMLVTSFTVLKSVFALEELGYWFV
jgi:hypothetical protein